MRPLFHPAVEDITVQGILHALSDPLRARIFMALKAAEGGLNCTRSLRENAVSLPKSTLSQHFRLLREAGLIHSERKGVELQNRTRCNELKPRFGALIAAILEAYAAGERF